MKNFLNLDEQIDMNLKELEFYHNSYQRTQNKLTILILLYSVIAVYILQIIKYPFTKTDSKNIYLIILYFLLLIIHLYFLTKSINYSYKLLKPVEVLFLNPIKFFYTELRKQYETKYNIKDENELNEYLKISYLYELEMAVEHNSKLFEKKGKYYYNAFKNGLLSIIFYLICASFVIFQPNDYENKIIIKNYKDIINYKDSTKLKSKKLLIMAEKKKTTKDTTSQKIKIDPKKIIKTTPRRITESFSRKDTNKNSINKPNISIKKKK